MDAQKREKYEQRLTDTREEIQSIEAEVERELAAVKERLAVLQGEKEGLLTIYEGYCRLLGVPNELAGDDEGDEE